MTGWLKALGFECKVGLTAPVLSFTPVLGNCKENPGLDLLFKLKGLRYLPAEAVVISIDRDSSEHLRILDHPDKW